MQSGRHSGSSEPTCDVKPWFLFLNPCFYFDFYYENGFDIISSLSADGAVQTENGQNKKIKFHIDWNHNNPDMRFKLWDIERQTKNQ